MYAIYSLKYVLTLIDGQMRLQTGHLVEWLRSVLASHEIASLFPGALSIWTVSARGDGGLGMQPARRFALSRASLASKRVRARFVRDADGRVR